MVKLHTDQIGTAVLATSDDLLLCRTCGTQYEETDRTKLTSCRICDDPRQYVPPSGQEFTTLGELRDDAAGYKLVFTPDEDDDNVTTFQVQPKVGIGQRGFLIRTPHGTIIWDIVCFLDAAAVAHINTTFGRITAIVISHPHFYTTWPDWARTFACPVHLAAADAHWLNRRPPPHISTLHLLTATSTEIVPDVTALVAGGHFPGSTMLYVRRGPVTRVNTLFHADTIHLVPSAKNPAPAHRTPDTATYAFMWSVPNMVPLGPEAIARIWEVMRAAGVDHEVSHGLMDTVRWRQGQGSPLIERVLESAKIAVRAMGYTEHKLLNELAK